MEYKKTTITRGMVVEPAVEAVLDSTPKKDKKYLARLQIQDNVFDLNDSVADNAKMISLLTTLMSRMYDTFSTSQKNLLSTTDRALLEHVFTKFNTTDTRADLQVSKEGATTVIDKLLDRQAQIGQILTNI